MKRMSTLRCAVFVIIVFVSSAVTATASAAKVPGLLLLSPETFPLTFTTFLNSNKTELQSVAGALRGEGVSLTLSFTSDNEGTFTAEFRSVRNKALIPCTTLGDSASLLLSGKMRLVHDISAVSGNGLLFEPNEAIISCGTEVVHVKGTMLGLIGPLNFITEDDEDIEWIANSLCKSGSGGEPLEQKFWGLAGVEEKAKLEANFGTGYKKACILVESYLELKSNKMAELMEVG